VLCWIYEASEAKGQKNGRTIGSHIITKHLVTPPSQQRSFWWRTDFQPQSPPFSRSHSKWLVTLLRD
jgi:hypothetical protein